MFESKSENKAAEVAPTISSVAASPATSSGAMTYAQLLHHGCAYLESEGMAKQQVKNLASALRLWVDSHGYSMAKVVAEEFGVAFDASFTRFCDVIAERLAIRTQKDRQEQLLRWRRVADALRHKDTLPAAFSDALLQCLRQSPLTLRQIARESGIGVHSLQYWSSGRGQPRGEAVNQLPKLEAVLELPKATLVSRLPLARRTRYARGVEKNDTTTSFTKVRRAQLARVGHYAMTFTPRLTQQWTDLLRLKTDRMRDEARGRNTWRVKPIERVGIPVTPAMFIDGQVCPTGAVHWANFSSYLGWLKLPAPEGYGMNAPEADTLAWLADAELVVRYARWRINFSGQKFHNGVNVFLQLVESYLRPKTGFLWLRHDLLKSVPALDLLSEESVGGLTSDRLRWQHHCEVARRKIRAFRERAEDSMGIRLSRDPTERIAVILHDEFPLKRLVAFVETLERSAPPPAHHRDYCAWIRDVLMCRLFISNPLRVSQYAVMTFRADGTGNLLRVGPGQYRIKFDASDFKNEKGAAHMPYDVAVDPFVAPWIDRYLTEARPYLIEADETDRLLLAAAVGPRKTESFLEKHGMQQNKGWSAGGMLHRLKVLTSTYIESCPGFGPHAFRHVIATDHLRRNPGDYLNVATLLHDKLETVLKSYGHLRVADGLRVLSSGIREATSQLSAERLAA
jgi:hypothetical protein